MYGLTRALGWYYSAVNVLRPRSESDRAVLGTGVDSGALLQVFRTSHNFLAVDVVGCLRASRLAINAQGSVGGLTVAASASNPTAPDLTANCAVMLFMRNGKLAFAFSCAGTMNYLAINLDGVDVAWQQGTEPP